MHPVFEASFLQVTDVTVKHAGKLILRTACLHFGAAADAPKAADAGKEPPISIARETLLNEHETCERA